MPLDDLLSRLAQNLLHPKVVVEDKVADDAVLATAAPAPAASLSRTTAAAHLLILLGRALLLRTALRGGGRRRVLRLAAEHQHEGHQVEGLAGRHDCRAASAAVAVANQIKADRLVFAPGEADAEAGLLLLHQAAVVELQNARVEGCTGSERVQRKKKRKRVEILKVSSAEKGRENAVQQGVQTEWMCVY